MAKNFKQLIGAAVDKTIAAANSVGIPMPMYTGRSNTVPPPDGETAGKPPEPASIIVSQVAERWVNEVSANLQPETLAGYLRQAIAGDVFYLFQFFEEMEEKWPMLRGALCKHRLKVCQRQLRIAPPDHVRNPDLAKRKADLSNVVFSDIRNLPQSLFHLTDAITKGISLAEIDWQVVGGNVTINELRWVNYRHLGYWYDSPELRLFPNLLNRAAPIVIPDRKFVCVEHLTKSGHPARASLLRPLAWYFLIYLYAIKDWATLAETFGIDVAWATMKTSGSPGATDTQREKALLHLSRIAARAGVFDEGTNINIERAAGSGAPPQEALVKYCNEKALELILGSSITTMTPKYGTEALGKTQQEEGEFIINWTALLTGRALTDQAMRWLCEFNFAEPGDNPVFELPGTDRKDLKALADVLNILVSVGFRVSERWVHEETGIPRPQQDADSENDDLILRPGKTLPSETAPLIGSAIPQPLVADGRHNLQATAQHALDALRAQAIAKGRDIGAFDQIAGPIRELVAGSEPAAALAKLRDVQKTIEPSKLEGVGTELNILADLLGRAVAEEAKPVAHPSAKTLVGMNDKHDPANGEFASGGGAAGEIGDLHDEIAGGSAAKKSVKFGTVDKAEAARIEQATGLKVEGCQHQIDADAIRHSRDEHPNLRREDFERIPQVITAPDKISRGRTRQGLDAIKYEKKFNGTTVYVEEVRTGKQVLAMKKVYTK